MRDVPYSTPDLYKIDFVIWSAQAVVRAQRKYLAENNNGSTVLRKLVMLARNPCSESLNS